MDFRSTYIPPGFALAEQAAALDRAGDLLEQAADLAAAEPAEACS